MITFESKAAMIGKKKNVKKERLTKSTILFVPVVNQGADQGIYC